MFNNRSLHHIFLFLLTCLLFTFASCSFDGAGSETTDGTSVPSGSSVVTVTGSLNPGGALPQNYANLLSQTPSENSSVSNDSNIANSAFPSIPATGITYTVTAVNTASGSTESYTGEALTVDGSLTYRVGIPVPATAKNYKIKVSAIYDESEILSGESEEFTISTSSPVASKNVTLSAAQSTGGKGNVALEIDVSGTQITKGMCSFCSTPYNVSDGKITVSVNLLDSQTYSGTFYFYDNSDTVLYKFKEKVNVFDGLTTNTWVQNGAEPWFVTTGTGASKTTACRITSAMVEGFKLTDIYVDPAKTLSGTGSFLSPVKSFNDAIEKLTDATKDYTINIVNSNTLHALANIAINSGVLKTDGSGTYNAKTLKICGTTDLDADGFSQNCIDGSSNRQCLKLDTDVPVTLKNLEITDGLQECGAGIYTTTNLDIDNCIISTCNAEAAGGGLCISGNSETVMSGGIIKENSAVDNGGGVYIELNTSSTNHNFTMTGGEITGNSADNGGGVYAYADFSMSGGVISGNTASEYGGGVMVYNNSTFTMSGGTISGNKADTYGGAVYVYGTFKMKGSAYIPAGVDGETGSGKNDVYLPAYLPARTIKIAGKLTPPAACTDGIVATITPASYTAGTQLIELDTGVTDTTLEEAAAHFAVTPDASNPGIPWRVSEEGKLIASIDAASLTTENYAAVTEITVSDGAGMKKLSDLNKNYSGKTIQLENDIVLPSGYSPIATFTGNFNGNGKKISGLAGQTALFNTVGGGGTVKDLTVEGSSTIAGIAENLGDGVIEGCTNLVNVTHTENDDKEAGGIVGLIRRSSGNPVVRNCVNKGTIKSAEGYVGGIAGREYDARCTMDSCVNTGTVEYTGDGYRIVGGIVGDAGGIVRNCINTGEVKGGTGIEAGGIAGSTSYYPDYGEKGIYNCANLGSVSADYRAGGITGNCHLSSSTDVNSTIKNCFNTGNITISDTSKTSRGGIAGEIETGNGTCTITNCFYYVPSGITINGVGKPNGVSVSIASTTATDAATNMNSWVNSNNSENLYKTWTTKYINGRNTSVPDVGYEW